MAYAKKTLWPCGCYCGGQAHSHEWPLLLTECVLCSCCQGAPSFATAASTRQRSEVDRLCSQPFPSLSGLSLPNSLLHYLGFQHGPTGPQALLSPKAYQLGIKFGKIHVQTSCLTHFPGRVTSGELFNFSEPQLSVKLG